jgi:hypothetical protein
MPRRKLRPQGEVIERCAALRGELRAALDRLPSDDPAVVDAVWRGEALGTLRDQDEIALEQDAARLWHWRARTTEVQAGGHVAAGRYASFDQLIAATAMRGYEQGLLPAPLRGDFPAYGKIYRHLGPEQLAEAHSIAAERQHALNWVAGAGESWDDVPLDT